MIKFEYDNTETDKLILEFKCKNCLVQTKTVLLSVPKVDLKSFRDTKQSYIHNCQCGVSYPIDIYNGLCEGYGIIQGIEGEENDIIVHERADIPYDKDSILVDTINAYSRIESIVKGIKGLSKEDKNYVYCLLFSNLISILDSFIKIYTEPIVLGKDDLIEQFSLLFGMPKGNREKKIEKIKDFYKRKSFQSVSNQKKLFEDVFNFEIEIDERIEHYVSIRDMIIHRNAIDPEGFMHKINKSQLLQALDVIKEHIRHIHSALFDYEVDMYADKILNRQYI